MQYKKICPICGYEFYTNHPNHKYCCYNCSEEASRIRAKEYNRRQIEEKNKRKIEKIIDEIGNEAYNYLNKLAEEQQQITIYKKTYCEACNISQDKAQLIIHNVSYSPQKIVTLCRKCHELLHKKMLDNIRCKNKIIVNDQIISIKTTKINP
jgi:NADH:ubiquinone oxidoreductase subunit